MNTVKLFCCLRILNNFCGYELSTLIFTLNSPGKIKISYDSEHLEAKKYRFNDSSTQMCTEELVFVSIANQFMHFS